MVGEIEEKVVREMKLVLGAERHLTDEALRWGFGALIEYVMF